MERTNDGFIIAEKDLELRGPGDFLGTRQSGLPELPVANLVRDGQKAGGRSRGRRRRVRRQSDPHGSGPRAFGHHPRKSLGGAAQARAGGLEFD